MINELLARNARLGIFMLGGDHSVAWPVVAALARHVSEPWAIVHVDAHTDLLPERLGVRLCFATWAYHANELLGRGGRLVQVGVRASSRSKQHWESTLGVRQFWADEIASLTADLLCHRAHRLALGARARALMIAQHGPEAYGARIDADYETLLSGHAARDA